MSWSWSRAGSRSEASLSASPEAITMRDTASCLPRGRACLGRAVVLRPAAVFRVCTSWRRRRHAASSVTCYELFPHGCASSFPSGVSPVGASGPPWGRSCTQGGGSLACQCHAVMALSLGLSQNVSTGTSACLSRVAVLVVTCMFTVSEVEITYDESVSPGGHS